MSRNQVLTMIAEAKAAQERGEVATGHDGRRLGVADDNGKTTAADLGRPRYGLRAPITTQALAPAVNGVTVKAEVGGC